MMDRVWINPEYEPILAGLKLTSFAATTGSLNEAAWPRGKTVHTRLKTIHLPDASTLDVFYKLYEHRLTSWRFIGRASKARCEFRNYEVFHTLGIATAEHIACGESRDWLGRLRRAFIITRAIPQTQVLTQFVADHCPDRATASSRNLRETLVRQLAKMTRTIHDEKFFHHDLVWRNILVSWNPPTAPTIWWIDCPRGGFVRWEPLQRHRRIKDLASLDKLATRFCTTRERVAFMKHYLGCSKLDKESKQLLRDTLGYRKRRWPEDWH